MPVAPRDLPRSPAQLLHEFDLALLNGDRDAVTFVAVGVGAPPSGRHPQSPILDGALAWHVPAVAGTEGRELVR